MDQITEGELVLANVIFKYKLKTKSFRGYREMKKEIREMVISRQYVSTWPKLEHETDHLIISKIAGNKLTKRNHKINEIFDVEVIGLDIIVRTGLINKRP